MKIWHIGASFSPQKVCGVNNTVWLVAREQARLGYKIALVLDRKPDEAALAKAEETGLELIHIPANRWRYDPKLLNQILNSTPPQLVHMHSVFIPKQATLAANLVRNKIPYAITPHGGLYFRRSRIKKLLYSWLLEKRRFFNAVAIAALTPAEEQAVRAFVPRYQGICRLVSNPIDFSKLQGVTWKGNIEAKKLVFLGRFDVLQKGIDILVEIARSLPEAEFNLYGNEDAKTKEWLKRIKQNLPKNVYFNNPIFDTEKNYALANATLYIQASRWEGFGISIAEAMSLGIPCAIPNTLGMADILRPSDLAILLPSNPSEAALYLKEVLNQPSRLEELSVRGKAFAEKEFQPSTVAKSYLNLYEEALESL